MRQGFQWIIGDGKSVWFWLDNWLGQPILNMLGITSTIPLNSMVADVIKDHK